MRPTSRLKSILPVAIVATLSACGTGNEPFGVLGNNLPNGPQSIPTLSLPIADSVNWTNTTSYNTLGVQADGFDFNVNAASLSLLAPAEGVVFSIATETTSGQSLSTLVIAHSGRLSSRISRVYNATVQIGQFVAQGSIIGSTAPTVAASTYPRLAVLLDGTVVCPYSYFTVAARHSFQTGRGFIGTYPCVE